MVNIFEWEKPLMFMLEISQTEKTDASCDGTNQTAGTGTDLCS
jgi:hypothetical protein